MILLLSSLLPLREPLVVFLRGHPAPMSSPEVTGHPKSRNDLSTILGRRTSHDTANLPLYF